MRTVRRAALLLLTGALAAGVDLSSVDVADARPVAAATPAAAVSDLPVSGRLEIGRSVEGRRIDAWRIGDPDARRAVVLIATLHGDEPAPRRILRNLRRGPRVGGVDLWVVPVANPDGLAARTRQNARGVDLNRNFRRAWVRQTGEKDSGPRPASEPETRALARFLNRVEPQRVLSYHQPLYGVDTYDQKRPRFTRRVARALALPLRSFDCRGGCHGTLTQWFNGRHDGAALTVEYGRGLSRAGVRRAAAGVLTAVGATR